MSTGFDAVVLAGGVASRLGGRDKARVEIGGVPLLDRVLSAVTAARHTVVVGPPRASNAPGTSVTWCREQPPGGGPVAGLAAGLPLARHPIVLVFAVDLPWIAGAVTPLLAALEDDPAAGAAVLVDATGRRNYLAAAWRRSALQHALGSTASTAGASMRSLYATTTVVDVPDTGGWGADCDTPEDIARAERLEIDR